MLDRIEWLADSDQVDLEDILADGTLLTLTVDIVSAHVSNNTVAAGDVPMLIASVYDALAKTAVPADAEAPKLVPAVSIRSSVKPDYLVCLEDGKKLTMLKRSLSTNFNLTPGEYRAKWGLPKDYPMVAPNYAERRRSLVRAIGLGKKSRKPSEVETPVTEPLPKPRRKLGIASAKTAAAANSGGGATTAEAAPRQVSKTRAKQGDSAKLLLNQ